MRTTTQPQVIFMQPLESRTPSDELIYASVAYAEFELGNYAESTSFLSKLIALHPQDPLFRQDLRVVQQKQGQPKSEMPGRENPQPQPSCAACAPSTRRLSPAPRISLAPRTRSRSPTARKWRRHSIRPKTACKPCATRPCSLPRQSRRPISCRAPRRTKSSFSFVSTTKWSATSPHPARRWAARPPNLGNYILDIP